MPTTLTVHLDGKPVPLDECGWLQRKSCGCIVAALLAVLGDDVYATVEQAHKHLSPRKDTRAREIRDGYRIELITMAHYREHIGAQWECDEHRPEPVAEEAR